MSPELVYVLGGSLIAIIFVYIFNRVVGGWQEPVLDNAEMAVARLALDYPQFEAADVLVCRHGRSAILAEVTGCRVGLVTKIGDNMVTRVIGPGDVRNASLARDQDSGDEVLRVQLDDYSLPQFLCSIPDGTDSGAWRTRLQALTKPAKELAA